MAKQPERTQDKIDVLYQWLSYELQQAKTALLFLIEMTKQYLKKRKKPYVIFIRKRNKLGVYRSIKLEAHCRDRPPGLSANTVEF